MQISFLSFGWLQCPLFDWLYANFPHCFKFMLESIFLTKISSFFLKFMPGPTWILFEMSLMPLMMPILFGFHMKCQMSNFGISIDVELWLNSTHVCFWYLLTTCKHTGIIFMRSMEVLNPLSLKKLVLGLKCGFIRYVMLLCYFSVKLNFFVTFFLKDYSLLTVEIVSQHLKYFCFWYYTIIC